MRPRRLDVIAAAMVLAVAAAVMLPATPAHANLGASATPSPIMDRARDAIDNGDYDKAIKYLKRYLERHEDDADALNYMGYSLRKLQRYDEAEDYYLKALKIEPDHLGANEYLGELYLETDRPELARERMAVLEKACPDTCEELKELNEALGSYKKGEGP